MLKKVLNTLFMKFFTAVAGFTIIILVSHLLGTAGKGQQAVIAFNINIIMLVLTLMGNSTLIYLAPRKNFSQLFIPSLLWSVFCAIIVAIIGELGLLGIFTGGENTQKYFLQTVGISIIASVTEINYYFLMGKQKVIQANNLKLIYPLTNVVLIVGMSLLNWFNDIGQYVFSLWMAYIFSLIYGVIILREEYRQLYLLRRDEFIENCKLLFKLGAVRQIGGIAQTMVYRLSLMFMVFFFGAKGEEFNGIYSNATSISEAILLFGTSLALVQYSSLSNTLDNTMAKTLTIKMTTVNVIVTALGLLVVCLLPQKFWVFLFGTGFEQVGYYVRILAGGILLLSSTSNITQYFASRGNFTITASASVCSLINTLIFGYILIPKYNITGAALTAVIAYITGFLIEFIYFLKWIKRK
ncbi:MAG: polysaccharide biosynthesis C-terminal domain-containing protein [Bacteroidales bacterium]|nr:polysaccharide biosynthesis C-terminal domain-containing protein [Bacteroidales bacterium]